MPGAGDRQEATTTQVPGMGTDLGIARASPWGLLTAQGMLSIPAGSQESDGPWEAPLKSESQDQLRL